jgi:hypothetical protein
LFFFLFFLCLVFLKARHRHLQIAGPPVPKAVMGNGYLSRNIMREPLGNARSRRACGIAQTDDHIRVDAAGGERHSAKAAV